jgi:hypothetical protein
MQESFLRTAAEIADSHAVPPHWEPFGKPQDLKPKCCVTIGKYRSQMAASCSQKFAEGGTPILGAFGKPQDLQPKCCVTIGKYRSQMAASCSQIVAESGTLILGTLWQASGPPAKMLYHYR